MTIRAVSFTTDSLNVTFADGREVSAPLVWFPRLLNATDAEHFDWRLIGRRIGIIGPTSTKTSQSSR